MLGKLRRKIRTTIVVTIVETVAPESPPRILIKKHRGKGAESDVDDVVADENRGEQLVKVLQQL